MERTTIENIIATSLEEISLLVTKLRYLVNTKFSQV